MVEVLKSNHYKCDTCAISTQDQILNTTGLHLSSWLPNFFSYQK